MSRLNYIEGLQVIVTKLYCISLSEYQFVLENNTNPTKMQHYVTFYWGFHCLPVQDLSEEELVDLLAVLLPFDFRSIVSLPHGVVGWSALCYCGIAWSYSLTYLHAINQLDNDTDCINFLKDFN